MTDTLRHPGNRRDPYPAVTAILTGEEQVALTDTLRRFLADRCTEADVRRISDSETGHDPALWRGLVDLGVTGGAVGPVELGLVMEEGGAALLPAPLLSAAIAAVLLGREPQDLHAVVFHGSDDWTGRSDVRVHADRISGTARFVPDAAIADTILVATAKAVFAVHRADATVTPLPVFDRTRRMADVTFHGPATRVGDGSRTAYARDLAIVALAGEQAGGARRLLAMTVAYAAERHQFGRAIGSFQAIKHMAADLLLESESAISAARNAARKLAEDAPDKDAAIALAAFACADAFVRCAADGIQMHGGVAFTWDHPAHLYLRRARSGAQLYGNSDHWRERFVRALENRA